MKRLGPDKSYQRALMKRKYWRGPGTSIKWTIEQRVRIHDVLILQCRADYDPKEIAIFTFTWSTLRRKNIPSDKFYYGGKKFAAGVLREHIRDEEKYAKTRAMIDAELGGYAGHLV